MHLGWLVAVALCVTTESVAFQEKKSQVIYFLNSFTVSCYLTTLLLAFGLMDNKGNCKMDREAAKTILGHIKREDRQVHIAVRICCTSSGILICGWFLGSGKRGFAYVVLRQ